MAPFIKCTTASDAAHTVRYINASCIAQAIYDEDKERLTLILTASEDTRAPGGRPQRIELTGQEAADALKTLNDLS